MKKPAAVLTALALVASGCAVSYQQPLNTLPTPRGVKFPVPSESKCPSPSPSSPAKHDLWKQKKELRRKLKKELKVGVSQAIPRLSFRNPHTGEFEGFEIDLMTEIADAIFEPKARKRKKVVFVALPFAEAYKWLNSGTVDILAKSMTITCLREQYVDFSESYLKTVQTMLVRTGSRYKSIKDLRGQRVCSGEGTVSIENIWKLRGDMVVVTVPATSDCMLMLQQGQVEAISSDESILLGLKDMDDKTRLLTDSPPKGKDGKCDSDTDLDCTWFSQGSYGFAFRNGDKDLLPFVNLVLDEMRSGKDWKKIHDKWLPEHPGKGLPSDRPSGGSN